MKELYINEYFNYLLFTFLVIIIYIIIRIYYSIYYKNKRIFIIDKYGHVHKIINYKVKKEPEDW